MPTALDQAYAYRTTFRLIGKNGPDGTPLTVADGDNNVFLFPGTDAMATETGPVARTIAAVTDECFNRPEERRISGASGTLFQGCPIPATEFISQFAFGYTAEEGANGETNLAIAGPDSEECYVCDPASASELTWWLIEGICLVDCDGKVVGRQLNVIRAIDTAQLSRQLRRGGSNISNLGADLNITLASNDNFGTGPGGVIISNDPVTGLPGTNPQVVVNLDPAIDLTQFEEATCACSKEYFGCALTAAIVAANPELNVPMITG